MTLGFPHSLHDSDIKFDLDGLAQEGCGVSLIKRKFFQHYEGISVRDLMLEYDERIAIFREFGCHGEAHILEEGKRTWGELRSKIGEERFKEELIMTLSLALHATFAMRTGPENAPEDVRKIRMRVA